MHLDTREYPKGHLLTEVVAEKLGIYVNLADWTMQGDLRIFRMIVDAELDRRQLKELISSTIRDETGSYEFSHIETLIGPVVDQGPRRAEFTSYLRITFM